MRKTLYPMLALMTTTLGLWMVTGCSSEITKPTQTEAAQTNEEKPASEPEGVRSPSMLANTCAGCHGTDGASAGEIMPIIGGMEKEYMQLVLEEFKSGERRSTIMGRIAKGYSDSEIKAIASYLAAKPWISSTVKTDPKLVAMGKKIHEGQCKTCHDDGGRVQEDDAPRLAGQWPDYTLHYLNDCRAKGMRCQPRKMGKRVSKLSDEELRAMAHYYASEK
ncbi:MAG: c-type cytochrome [Candidatus Thiodiazotropha sp.]